MLPVRVTADLADKIEKRRRHFAAAVRTHRPPVRRWWHLRTPVDHEGARLKAMCDFYEALPVGNLLDFSVPVGSTIYVTAGAARELIGNRIYAFEIVASAITADKLASSNISTGGEL